MLIIDLSDPARLILLHCSFMFIRIKGMTLLLVRSTHIYYIMCLRAACLVFCSQSVKDRVSVPSFLESECKGTTFFRTDQTFRKLFSRKMRKKWERDKKMEKKRNGRGYFEGEKVVAIESQPTEQRKEF